MKSPLRIGARHAPKTKIQALADRSETGKARRFASLSAAAAIVVGVGAASALFVDYLADRALARTAEAPATVKPVMAKAVETSAETKVAAIAPAVAAPANQPVQPPKAEIAVAAPDPAALAKVAVGPEHAIELPADDPTANPIVKAAAAPAAEDASDDMPISAYAEEDGTQTAAIDPDTAEPALEAQPVKKPKRQQAEQAQPAEQEVASLPGVDTGGLAGQPSDDENADSTVQTVTKQGKNLGGVAAGTAKVTTAVNMRSSPKKGAGVLTVVPAGSAVNVLSCDGWCQIAYNGRTGWVYKNFLSTTAGAKPQKQQAAKPASAAAKPASPAANPAASAPRKAISSRL